MHCPFCTDPDTRVIDSRLVGEGNQVRRRRECTKCKERYTTYESAELTFLVLLRQTDGASHSKKKSYVVVFYARLKNVLLKWKK